MDDYLTYWQLPAPVFDRASGAEIFWSERRMALRSRLSSYPRSPLPFMAITGVAESGKSTILRWLHDRQLAHHNIVLTSIIHEEASPRWLSDRLCSLVGLQKPTPARRSTDSDLDSQSQRNALLTMLLERLDEARRVGRQLIILIDNADQLHNSQSWEELANLLNLQSLSDPALRIVVSGRPQLIDNLCKHHSLDRRLNCHIALAPLTIDEAEAYVRWAWQRMSTGPLPFDSESLHYLYTLSAGVVGRLAKLAEQALIEAACQQERQITIATVDGAKEFLVTGDQKVSKTKPQRPDVAYSVTADFAPTTQEPFKPHYSPELSSGQNSLRESFDKSLSNRLESSVDDRGSSSDTNEPIEASDYNKETKSSAPVVSTAAEQQVVSTVPHSAEVATSEVKEADQETEQSNRPRSTSIALDSLLKKTSSKSS